MLFYNPEDPPLMPLEASQALHRSQLLPAGVLMIGSLAWLASGTAGPPPLVRAPLKLLFGLALAVLVAVPIGIGLGRPRLATARLSLAMPTGPMGLPCWQPTDPAQSISRMSIALRVLAIQDLKSAGDEPSAPCQPSPAPAGRKSRARETLGQSTCRSDRSQPPPPPYCQHPRTSPC